MGERREIDAGVPSTEKDKYGGRYYLGNDYGDDDEKEDGDTVAALSVESETAPEVDRSREIVIQQ